MKHAGLGWPNGAVKGGNGHILALPSPDLLILGSEHWHYDEAVRAGKRILFRGMARQGYRPAEVGWNARRYVDEITRDAVRVSEPITDFVGWNELNLQDERGDRWNDHGDLTDLFSLVGQFVLGVISELRLRPVTQHARLHFGAWAPKDETDYTRHWQAAADACDVMDVHAYGRGEGILGHISKYRALFPDKPIELTEWHSDLAGPDEDRITLELLARLAGRDPDFRAYYFLWRWDSPPSHQQDLADAIDVEGNPERLDLFMHPPTATVPEPVPVPTPDPPPPPAPEPVPVNDIETFIREAARVRGIDPDIAVRVANSEGGITEPARRGTFDTGSSWWPFQLHYGGAGTPYEYLGTVAGMGNGFTALTGWQPGDPAAFRDSVRYALNQAKRGGWGSWYGAAHVGIGDWDGIDRSAPWDANSELWDYEGATPAPVPVPTTVAYDPDARVDAQPDDWSCSIQSTEFLLRSIGRDPGDQWIQDQLLGQGIVTPQYGLMDPSGRTLAAWITREYGTEMGFRADSADPVTFDDVLAGAGVNPTLIGGRGWGSGGHWSGVRRADENGWLELANPAPGYTGVGTHLNRAEWDARGPWSAIYIDLAAKPAEPPAPTPDPVPQAVDLAPWIEAVAYLGDMIGDQIASRASALRTQADALDAVAAEMRRVRVERVGPRP